MIDHEKLQKARAGAYAVGVVAFVLIAAWRLVIR